VGTLYESLFNPNYKRIKVNEFIYLLAGLLTGILIGGTIIWILRTRALRASMGLDSAAELQLRAELSEARATVADLRTTLTQSKEDVSELNRLLLEISAQSATFRERAEILEKRNLELRTDNEMQAGALREVREEMASIREKNENLREKLDNQKSEMFALQEQFKSEFEVLAAKILEDKSTKFTEQNKQNLSLILNPLNEKLQEFSKQVRDTYDTEMRERISLQTQIKSLTELNHKMSEDATNLTRALKGDSKAQGNWGEVILERILERSGLQRDREYRIQASHTTEDNRRLQPDVIIDLPDNKNLIVDSKVSITAYERYSSATDESEREKALKEHVLSIRAHVKSLSEKKYQTLYKINSPDFVLMFIPVEPAFALAIQLAPDLYNEAFEKNIVIVSPSTLLATMFTIASIWKQEYQNKNATEIARQGGALYDKFVGFIDDMESIGKSLAKTAEQHENAFKKLSTGSGNLIGRADKLRKLGISASKQLSASLTNSEED
jgi:DNA recombination protein RmuC